jgi:hypothetical protein
MKRTTKVTTKEFNTSGTLITEIVEEKEETTNESHAGN